ncbi:hypothetical protein PV08_02076 [Exophiala spinifera]|uniref:Uncharacterized protein n=1 Tax=Exophiala spinifera TaxID=91928 RepID=A0A0D1Z1I6_9EURO|nr:uncharacterized protein PV08_02076 [Exophiala spinifera]KIW21496.1 hypothetical protein PV08_02076 [Exophiala spinifera]
MDHTWTAHPEVGWGHLQVDLSRVSSVKKAASEINGTKDSPEIDIVICNAGLMWIRGLQRRAYNSKTDFATDHIGHFLFVSLILPKLIAVKEQKDLPESERANLAVMGAYGFGKGGIYSPVAAHGQSKTAAILVSLEHSRSLSN